MHIDHLSITLCSAHRRRDHNQGVLGDKIPDTSFSTSGLVGRGRDQVEFQRICQVEREQESNPRGKLRQGLHV